MKKIKLFCIPYSGGSASVYYAWKKFVPEFIELLPVELKGHGTRIREPLAKSVGEAVEDIANIIASKLEKDDPYAILGHSMGSALAYEVYYKLKEMGYSEPVHMFFSGRKSPINSNNVTEFYKKSDEDFLNIVYKYGGTTREIMANKELRDLFLPILRSDFMIAETYYSTGKPEKMHCAITVTNGNEDLSIATVNMDEWREITDQECSIQFLPGDHFFLIQNPQKMIEVIKNKLI